MNRPSNVESLRNLAFLYSRSTFKKAIQAKSLLFLQSRIKKHKHVLFDDQKQIVFGQFLSRLYEQMANEYCNEYIFKNELLVDLLINKYSLKSTTILSEMRVEKSIADIIFVNGEVKIFEIKTDLDSLKRLDCQLYDYQKISGKIYLVANKRFITQILDRYSTSDYGIIEYDNYKKLTERKQAITNFSYLSHDSIFKLLRKEEYLNIVKSVFGYVPDVPNTLIFKESLQLVQTLDVKSFHNLAFEEIKKRQIIEPELFRSDKTPYAIKFICHSLNLSSQEYNILHNLLEATI